MMGYIVATRARMNNALSLLQVADNPYSSHRPANAAMIFAVIKLARQIHGH